VAKELTGIIPQKAGLRKIRYYTTLIYTREAEHEILFRLG
jgi:hypothetical protein